MFGAVAWFELRYQLKNPVLWVTFILFFLMTFGSVTSDYIQIGAGGNTNINSPFAIGQTISILGIFAQFAVVAFVANVVIRDTETGFGSILHATRIGKFDYLIGRFLGAFAASLIVLAAVPLAMIIGSAMPWLDPERLGPFNLWHYVQAFLVAGVPTMFISAALFFALATATRSMMATYVGLVAFLVFYLVMSSIFSRPDQIETAALFDPYGNGAIAAETRYWTASDRNTRLPPITELWLINRAIWGGVALAALAGAYFTFSFSARPARKAKRERAASGEVAVASVAGAPLSARGRFDAGASWVQVLARARFEAANIFRSPAFIVLMAIGLFNAGGGLWFADESAGGVKVWPVTLLMAETLFGAFSIIPMIIATYYAGELVWRDRERRIHDIIDSTPAPDWTFVTPKILALTLVLAASIAISVLAGVGVQLAKGFTAIRLDQYLTAYAVPAMIFSFQIAALAVFLQAISPHKFVGWGLMLVYLVSSLVLGQMGFDHNLYNFGGTPGVPLSEMNLNGHYWIGAAWFNLYWCVFSLILIVLAYSLWRRGADTRLMPRLRRLPRRLSGFAGGLAAVLVVAFAGLGGWIFYNTNVLNEYRPSIAAEKYLADMEKALLKYDGAPMPKITDVVLAVDLHPHEHEASAIGTYSIENRSGAPLTEIHLLWPRDLTLDRVEIDGASLEQDFADGKPGFPFQIWSFAQPMQPGERREIRFATRIEHKGFRNSGVLTSVNDNGTFINDRDIAPVLGFDRSVTLQDRNLRRKYGLPPDLRMAKLEDDSALAVSYIRHDADWVNADITVSTVANQTPIAPGYLVSDETKDGRRTARFRTDAPILNFFSMQSADYEVKRDKWNDIDLAVYYDERHPYNVDRMIRAMKVSFEVFEREFSPYQFKQMRILEFPRYASFAQAFANTVPYSEAIGFISRYDDKEAALDTSKIDFVTYVIAHELAHQWWAHQVIGADMQGSTMLSETFASYSALLVMEEIDGPDQVRRFLRYELDSYLRSRGSEVIEELPLMRVENQGYVHYRKGGVAMYFLRNEIGDEAVNRALSRLIERFAFKGAPYPRTTDFLAILREEAGPQHEALITDIFEKITLYDAKATEAKVTARPDGKWDVTLSIDAKKLYADGEGKETEAPLAEDFEIGVFAAEPGRGAFKAADVIAFERRPLKSGAQTITLTVDREPKFAGVDPYNKRIDRNSDDNVVAVK